METKIRLNSFLIYSKYNEGLIQGIMYGLIMHGKFKFIEI